MKELFKVDKAGRVVKEMDQNHLHQGQLPTRRDRMRRMKKRKNMRRVRERLPLIIG